MNSTFVCIKAANMNILDEFGSERDCIKGFGGRSVSYEIKRGYQNSFLFIQYIE